MGNFTALCSALLRSIIDVVGPIENKVHIYSSDPLVRSQLHRSTAIRVHIQRSLNDDFGASTLFHFHRRADIDRL